MESRTTALPGRTVHLLLSVSEAVRLVDDIAALYRALPDTFRTCGCTLNRFSNRLILELASLSAHEEGPTDPLDATRSGRRLDEGGGI